MLTDKANYLAGKGHEVMIVTFEQGNGPMAYEMSRQVRHTDVACHFFSIYKQPVWRRMSEAFRVKRLFCERMGEVLKTFCPDVIVVTVPLTEMFVNDLMAIAGKTPVVVESHLAFGRKVLKRGLTERLLLLWQNPISALRQCSMLIALTEGDAACWKEKGFRNVKVLPNSIPFYPEQNLMPQHNEKRVICVGRLTRQKRFDRLIDAFALIEKTHPDWVVDIFGDGEEKENLKRQIEGLGLQQKVLLHDPVADIVAAYMHSELFVLSSDFEGFGLVIVEAMACGLPVVATDCPYGPSEIVADGETGLLAKMDVKDLAEKMKWMMAHETERKAMGLKAYKAAARYKKELVMAEWEQAYLSVIS